MKHELIHIALVVKDYDEALDFYVRKLNFELIEDTYQEAQDKRWVVVAPKGSKGITILLAKAKSERQEHFIGDQTGGRVFLFLSTDDFWQDYQYFLGQGIKFVRSPKKEDYGIVAVFKDLYGNLWDLVQFEETHHIYKRINEVPFEIVKEHYNKTTETAIQEVNDMISGKIEAKDYYSLEDLKKDLN